MLDIYQLIEQCAPNVEVTTMLRIIGVESTQNPNAIGYKITKGSTTFLLTRQPGSLQEATSWASWLLNNGYRFDAGIAQVNSNNFAKYYLDATTVFDPCKNINVGAQILGSFYSSAVRKYGEGQQALYAAISAYQSGNFVTGFSTGYVQKVVTKIIPKNKFIGTIPPLEMVVTTETISLETYDQFGDQK